MHLVDVHLAGDHCIARFQYSFDTAAIEAAEFFAPYYVWKHNSKAKREERMRCHKQDRKKIELDTKKTEQDTKLSWFIK